DRLTEAKYSLNNNAYGTEYGYDQRGNFTSIKRRGVYSDGLNFLPQVIDLMQFTPTSNNSNKIQTITDNAPCPDNKVIHQALDNTQMHAVATELQADNVVNENADITYQAGTEITLKAGFHAKAGTNFVAKIADCPQSGFETDGFVQRSTDSYLYDANGNRINDPQNNITNVAFNYLNQPYKVTWANGNTIEWLRDGSGGKLQQLTKRNDVEIGKLDYIGGSIEYEQDTLARIYLKDAKLTFNGGVFDKYVYYLKNHLMSTQVVFEDDGNGVAKLLSQHQQYPFGLEMKGDFVQNRFTKKLYNFKEQTFDFGLGWMDFGARFYTKGDVPTFLSIDPLTHIYTYQSPYAYADNNPVKFIDFMGLGSSYNWNTERYEDEDGNEVSWASVQSEYGIGNAAGNDPPNGGVGVSIYHYENAKQNNWDGASFTFGLTLSAGLLADDATGIGVVDDVAIPFVMVGATALTLYDNRKLIKEWADDISKTVTRNYGSGVGFQYTLRATADGYYPTMSWGSRGPVGQTYLNSGEIWKIGETSKGQRYTTRYLNNIGPGVRMVPEFYGTIPQIKLVEKMKIWSYVFRNFNLPPGNKMFR
ncbi:MAG: 3-coathanger stack domain-containing protein, partial [Bacteroidota bacterium]